MSAALFRWVISLVGVQSLAGIVWVLGPLLPQFEDPPPRLAAILGLLALWLLGNFLLDWRRRARDRRLTQGVAGGVAAEAEAAALQEKLGTALAMLKQARGKRGYLYEQPWYVMIGPPGAGKTTALLNAGLHFPLAEGMGRGAVAGVGGTRLCDWWFTDEAVLIDTAGRYTTQDSDAAVDRAGWDTFLGLLKATRPKQPLNGVLVAIALTDVAGNAAERLAHARAIRRRIKELETRLGMRLPVYALFTKADLLAGFSEFFDDLDRAGREQVWGMTFPYRPGKASSPSEAFPAEFRLLAERLDRRMFDRLQAEDNPDRRALIAAFPAQFASVEPPVNEFLQEAFGSAPGDPGPLLRGAYFTSATQDGTPIDRLTGAITRAFGLDQRRAPRLRPEEGRTYFLTGQLRRVVFREAMLVSSKPGAARQRVLLRSLGFVACLLVLAGGAVALWRERAAGLAAMDAAGAALAGYEQQASTLPLDPVADSDLAGLAPLLDAARALLPDGAGPLDRIGLGLSQGGKLQAGARAAYRHALQHALFPRLVWRLESQMRGNLGQPDFMYEATRVYLMLGGQGAPDRDLVREWVTLDWEETYPGAPYAPLRASLARHLDALLAEPLPAVALDGDLVAQARATFGRVSLAQRIYSRIKPSAAAQRLAPWRPSDPLGAAGVKVFIRSSGKPLDEGIPGFYTAAGFRTVLLPALPRATQEVTAESWVLGQKVEPDPAQLRSVEREVVALYTAEYIQAWDAMLADLDLAPLRSLTQAAQDLYIIGSQQYSPMRDLLASAARNFSLAAPAPEPASLGPASRLQGVLGRPAGTEPDPPSPGSAVDVRYKPLRDLVGTGAGAPIDQVMKPIFDLQQQLAKIAASTTRAVTPAAGEDPAAALRTEALRQPQPLARWLNSIAASGIALRGGGARQQIIAAYNAGGGPAAVCPVIVTGRYPFTPGSSTEASLEDFGRLFGPGGALDAFFNTQLKPYVDLSARPWKLQAVDGVSAPVSAADLAQFQRAALIRDMYFARGGKLPQVRFDITPTGMDAGASQAALDLGGTGLAYARGGPPRPAQITWPDPGRVQAARLTFDPPPANGAPALQESGAWSVFRLFGRGRVQAGGSAGADRATLTLQSGERQANFDLRASPNPFTSPALQEFRCPVIQ